MPQIDIYTTRFCPYCVRAKRMLERKGVSYNELPIDTQPGLSEEMIQRSQRTSVPQIFIDDFHVGGFDDMAELDMDGKLDPLLGDSGES